jgi:hypothetical protein
MYVIGEIIQSEKSRKKLEELGWECKFDEFTQIYLTIPKNYSNFFKIPNYLYEGLIFFLNIIIIIIINKKVPQV